MKTTEELEAMMPPELTAIPGCTGYNKTRDDALQKIMAQQSMAERRIGRLNPDDLRAVLGAEAPFTDALVKYERECRALEKERKRLLCEPGAKSAGEIVWNTSALKVSGGPGASAFNKRVAAFSDRRMKALKGLQRLATKASAAFYLASIEHEGKIDDALLLAKNKAERGLAAEARPFILEHKALLAERAKRFGK
ncbi:MAG: hypothetical protein KKD33_07875 [Verrucomicrobia bacterium]|nr:hypothetical protein [Verrucomicrobiota bacterium]